ncbi:MAG TPA: ABC transporter permease [Candidatus Hydrogenedentes bacterium]|nr:ABC transporter permease [Candidatus Hydrogenedentota bacterium]
MQIASSRIYLDEEIVRAARQVQGAIPTLTYLVNGIRKGDRSTPYSFVTAGPVPVGTPEGGAVINQWLAETLEAGPGDELSVDYWHLLPSNVFVEKTRTFTVHRVLSMEDMAIERDLAPLFPGLSDVDTCRDWDIGMPLDEGRLSDPDNEAYWNEYGQTPKLMTTFESGRELWGTRFGSVTGLRFPPEAGDAATLQTRLRAAVQAEALGLVFNPVRAQALASVDKAMNFGGLFLGLSFFLIASSLILLGLLFVYGLQQRAAEMGLLKALGWPLTRIRALFLIEALPTALLGLIPGILAGVAYAHLLLLGLAWRWPAALAGTPVSLHVRPATLLLGGMVAFICVFAVVLAAAWRGTRHTARALLNTDFSALDAGKSPPKTRRPAYCRHGGFDLGVAGRRCRVCPRGQCTGAFLWRGRAFFAVGVGVLRRVPGLSGAPQIFQAAPAMETDPDQSRAAARQKPGHCGHERGGLLPRAVRVCDARESGAACRPARFRHGRLRCLRGNRDPRDARQ